MYSGELLHYGVLGQKWGVRRYQNRDGTYTAAGKSRYSRAEIKVDNKVAFEKGRAATIDGRTSYYTDKIVSRNKAKLTEARKRGQDGNVEQLEANYTSARRAAKTADKKYQKSLAEAMAHADELVKKYGKENVSSLKYKTLADGRQVLNESIYTGKQKALGVMTFIIANLPLGTAWMYPLIPMPAGVKGAVQAEKLYRNEKRRNNS